MIQPTPSDYLPQTRPLSGRADMAAANPPPPPPPPRLSAVQAGDLAAGRLSAVEGQLFAVPPAGSHNAAPPAAAWGEQPAGTPYRQTFDSVAARIGTRDPVTVGAEIDRQLYGTAAPSLTSSPASLPRPVATSRADVGSHEGVGSFIDGAVKGNFSDNNSWSAIGGQVVTGFIPVVGQAADLRDTVASVGQIARGESGGWLNLGASVVGWMPGVGDAAKAAIRGGSHAVEAGADVAKVATRTSEHVAETAVRQAGDAVQRKQIVMEGGRKGEWPKELNARNLEPNADYLVNGYRYATDAQGRVTSVEGKLDLSVAERNGYQQQIAGRGDRLPDDQGGHLIASIFNGPGDRLNLVPMNGNLNMGEWKAMENELASALKKGEDVHVKVDILYGNDSGRPTKFFVAQSIDGVERMRTFRNVAGGM